MTSTGNLEKTSGGFLETSQKFENFSNISEQKSNNFVIGTGLTSLQQVSQGNIPNNKDLLENLETIRRVLHEQREENKFLDEKGKQLALALERFLWTTETMIEERNWDQALQKFVKRAVNFGERVKREAEFRHGDLKESLTRLSDASSNLKRFFLNLFTSSETRRLILDVIGLAGSLLTLSAQDEHDPSQGKTTDISEDLKREISYRYRNILSRIGERPEFRDARQDIMELFDYLKDEALKVSKSTQNLEQQQVVEISNLNQGASTVSVNVSSSSSLLEKAEQKTTLTQQLNEKEDQRVLEELSLEFRQLLDEALYIIQRFAIRNDLKSFEQKFWNLFHDINHDPESNNFFEEMRAWSDSIVKNPETSNNEEVIDQGKKLIDRGILVRKKYGKRILELVDETKEVLKSLQEERFLNAYKQDLKQMKDITTSGSFIDVVAQFRHLALPIIKEMMKEIKFPPIEHKDSSGSVLIENIILRSKEIVLDDIYVDIKFGMKNMMKAVVKIKHVEALFWNVRFSYQRISIPQISDNGILNCHVKAKNWKIKMIVKEETGKAPFFELSEVKGGIKRLKIEIIEAKHKLIDTILLPLVKTQLKKRAQSEIEGLLKENGEFITQKMNEWLSSSPFGRSVSPLSLLNVSGVSPDHFPQPSPKQLGFSSM